MTKYNGSAPNSLNMSAIEGGDILNMLKSNGACVLFGHASFYCRNLWIFTSAYTCFSFIFLQKKNLHSHNMTPMLGGFSSILIGSRGFGEADSKMTSIFANSVERSTPPDQ